MPRAKQPSRVNEISQELLVEMQKYIDSSQAHRTKLNHKYQGKMACLSHLIRCFTEDGPSPRKDYIAAALQTRNLFGADHPVFQVPRVRKMLGLDKPSEDDDEE